LGEGTFRLIVAFIFLLKTYVKIIRNNSAINAAMEKSFVGMLK
jgi:hypothetical protein